MPQQDLSLSTSSSRITSMLARAMAGLSILLGAMWALITYAVPDPSVFGFSFINWRNVVLLVSTFSFLGAISIGWQIRNLPPVLRGVLQFFLVAGLSAIFFILGTEYAKPSFEFAKVQSKIVENEGSNLLGKRMEVLDNIRFELIGCENIGRLPSCSFDLTNLNVDREFRFEGSTQLFDEAGGALNFESLRVSQKDGDRWMAFQMIRNVPTRVTLTFQQTNNKLTKAPAVKLIFRSSKGEEQILKFSDIAMR